MSEKTTKTVNLLRRPQGPWKDFAFKQVYSRYVKPVHAYVFKRVRNHHEVRRTLGTVERQAW